MNPAPHPGVTRREGFETICPGAAKLCLGGSFIAVRMPQANIASNPGYLHQNNEGKKCRIFNCFNKEEKHLYR